MKRPSLPTGDLLFDSISVQRALYVSDDVEVYSIHQALAPGSHLLVLANGDVEMLERWWTSLCTSTIDFARRYDGPIPRNFSTGAIFKTDGMPLEDGISKCANFVEAEGLFQSFARSVHAPFSSGVVPRLEVKLCSIDSQGIVASLLPTKVSSESEAVNYIATSFYRCVTRIDVRGRRRPDRLSQWSKVVSPQLSQTIADCLPDESGTQRTQTFAKLFADIGRPLPSSSQERLGTKSSNADGTDRTFGLAKVAGMHRLKELLSNQVVGPLRNPEPFRQYGLSVPNGILLYGPPGCGKTYIARALAEELGHHFLEIVPSELASPFVHGSVIRIREVFDEAAHNAPSVVFIDEFEALAPVRSDLGGFQQYKAEEVNEILTHLNGAAERNIFVIAATNQPDLIDPAIRRTGRLDKLIYVSPPDREAREEMLHMHLSNRPVSNALDLADLSEKLTGYSASDVRFLVDEAARDALLRKTKIDEAAFGSAMSRFSPSIPPQLEKQYQSISERG